MLQLGVDRAVLRYDDLRLTGMTVAIPYNLAVLPGDVRDKILHFLGNVLTSRHKAEI